MKNYIDKGKILIIYRENYESVRKKQEYQQKNGKRAEQAICGKKKHMANSNIYGRMINATINQIKAKLDNDDVSFFISQNSKNKKKTFNNECW